MNITSQPGSYTELKSSVRAGLTDIIEKFTYPIPYFLAQVLANTTKTADKKKTIHSTATGTSEIAYNFISLYYFQKQRIRLSQTAS